MKWLHYPSNQNKWVKVEDMECHRLISTFEKNLHKNITAMKRNLASPVYKLLTEPNEAIEVSSEEARIEWPELVAEFLEKCVVWKKEPTNDNLNDINAPMNWPINFSTSDAIEILCTF